MISNATKFVTSVSELEEEKEKVESSRFRVKLIHDSRTPGSRCDARPAVISRRLRVFVFVE